ncbi:ribonuclease Oy-like [Bradysia coprophila]|uniref:ribonuclease Oy-like n=1 Tax=Bradysia coprophila TaxID=38358 RepID=UPI00187DD91C|nr:ribonuclease Oy-like [Bradysia coprophila]
MRLTSTTVSVQYRGCRSVEMLSKLEYLFISLIILCRFSFGYKCNAKPNMNPQFDTLVFVQQWPLTFCQSLMNQEKECKIPAQKGTWTIHGIWPSRFHTNAADQPSCCDSTVYLDKKGLQPIKEQLTLYWPTGQKDRSDESFWEYEWMKHGTCSVGIEGLSSSTNFFTAALHWLAEYNMTSILAKSNIIPDNEKAYKLLDVHTAIKSVLNRNPSINCYIDTKTGEQFLSEVRICFDRQLSIVDCDGMNRRTNRDNINTNCQNKPINYRGYGPDHTSDWFTYVGYFGLIVFVIVVGVGLLMKDSSIRQRIFGNQR